jgi:lipid-A-disaccharide synthase
MIVAGEPSGDAHAAALVHALQSLSSSELDIVGATGPMMREAGVRTIVPTDELSILGLFEIASALPRFLAAYKKLKQAAVDESVDAVILVDWPDFNLRLARALHRRGVKVIYYISPQLWAWRPHRVKSIKRDVDLLLAILPFERQWYADRGVDQVEYVGHPLAGHVHARYDKQKFCNIHDLEPARPIISLLPGSRHKELQRILPPMLDAAAHLSRQRPDAQFVLVIAPSRSVDETEEIIKMRGGSMPRPGNFRITHHQTREALAASDAAAVASGTATLEAALLTTPMVIVYKESPVNWHTLGRLITAEHFGLVNLIAGKRVVTELMQHDLNGKRLAEELLSLLEPGRNAEMRAQLREVTSKLGEGGASQRAAESILRFLK